MTTASQEPRAMFLSITDDPISLSNTIPNKRLRQPSSPSFTSQSADHHQLGVLQQHTQAARLKPLSTCPSPKMGHHPFHSHQDHRPAKKPCLAIRAPPTTIIPSPIKNTPSPIKLNGNSAGAMSSCASTRSSPQLISNSSHRDHSLNPKPTQNQDTISPLKPSAKHTPILKRGPPSAALAGSPPKTCPLNTQNGIWKPSISSSQHQPSSHSPLRTLNSAEQSRYRKKEPLLHQHKKTLVLRGKLSTLKAAMTAAPQPPRIEEPIGEVYRLLDQERAQKIPHAAYRTEVSKLNQLDNERRWLSSKHRLEKHRHLRPPASETLFQRSTASLESPRPPEPTLPTFDKLRDRQRLLDQTFGKKKTKTRKWRKSLEPDKLAFVDETFKKQGEIASLPGAYCEAHDIQKLLPRRWMNDEIATFYGVMINRRSTEAERAGKGQGPQRFLRAHCFSSFFMNKYDKEGYKGVQRWSKKVDLFKKDIIIFPVNISNAHWTCAAINLRKKRFEFYDSLGNHNDSVLANLRDYIVNESLAKRNEPLDLSDWVDYYTPDLPQQNNAYDCGIFVCQFMDSLSRDWGDDTVFDFGQENMEYMRTKMVYEIAKREFLDEEWG